MAITYQCELGMIFQLALSEVINLLTHLSLKISDCCFTSTIFNPPFSYGCFICIRFTLSFCHSIKKLKKSLFNFVRISFGVLIF